jgi:hypothetical protein
MVRLEAQVIYIYNMTTKFYTFNQNNTGGSFDFDKEKGITHYVIIEANSADDANNIAESLGIYFNGCDDNLDCPCCGDRWYPAGDRWDVSNTPTIYGQPITNTGYKWMPAGENVCVHYKDGRKEWA